MRHVQLTLLDFGAAREYPKQFIDEYIRVIKAAAVGDRATIIGLCIVSQKRHCLI